MPPIRWSSRHPRTSPPSPRSGGKLIFFHGDSDPWFSPLDTLDYYKSLAATNGGAEKVAEWSRIFLVPGMAHCGGGPALDHFDMLSAVVDWVEKGPHQNQ